MNIIVDLDGTLLKTDLLSEAILSTISSNYTDIQTVLKLLMLNKRLELKNYLVPKHSVNIKTLPYNQEVINKIKILKQSKNKIYVVSASPQKMVESIGKYLNLFDGVYGSNQNVNLKGEEKRNFLNKKFGKKNYEYFGNSTDDIYIWKDANRAYLVNTSKSVKNSITKTKIPFEILDNPQMKINTLLSAIRIKQWVKNILIFIPMIAGQSFGQETFLLSFFAFLSFSFIASGVYIFNDLLDIESDRQHNIKKNRVFASGVMQLETGFFLGVVFWIIGLAISLKINFLFMMILLLYIILTSLYSAKLKRVGIIDIYTLALLYTIRIWSGSVAIGIDLSVWLFALSIFLFYSLACVKRLGEIVNNEATGSLTIKNRGYKIDDKSMIQSMAIASGYAAAIVFALYLNSFEIQKYYNYPQALWGIWLVLLYWINYIIFMAQNGYIKEDPVIFAIKNRISVICGILILFFLIIGIIHE